MAKSTTKNKRAKSSASTEKEVVDTTASNAVVPSTKTITSKRATSGMTSKKDDPAAEHIKSKKDQKNQQRESRIVTMKALQEMSDDENDDADDDGELPPESEWNKEALALKAAIDAGTFDAAVLQSNNNEDDESPFEEVDLDSGDDDDEEEEEQENEEDEENIVDNEDDEEIDEEEEDDDEDDEEDDKDENNVDGKIKSTLDGTKLGNTEKEDDDDEIDDDDEEDNEDEGVDEDEEEEDNDRTLLESNATRAKALKVVTASLLAEKKNWDWAETFDIVPPTPLPFNKEVSKATSGISTATTNPLGIHDDLQREVAFYDVALEAVLEAKNLCNAAGIPFTRPDDFFAEMVKTDDHMAKVKDRLIFEGKKIEAVAQRKSNKEQKLRAKETQSNKLAEKAKKKRDHMQQVSDWAESAKASRGGNDNTSIPTNKKRAYSDSKFGHGGKRGRFKQNDPQSMNDMSSYNKKKGTFTNTPRTKQGRKPAAGANRPGKRARDASRSKSR